MPFLKPPLHFFLLLSRFHLPLLLLPFYLFLFLLRPLLLLLLQPRPALPIPSSLPVPFLLEISPKKMKPSGTKHTSLKKNKNSRTTRYNFSILTPPLIQTLSTSPLPELLLIT